MAWWGCRCGRAGPAPQLEPGYCRRGVSQPRSGRSGSSEHAVPTTFASCRPALASWRAQAACPEACRRGHAVLQGARQPMPRWDQSPGGPALSCWAVVPSARPPSCNPAALVPGMRRAPSDHLPRCPPARFPLWWVALPWDGRLVEPAGGGGGGGRESFCCPCPRQGLWVTVKLLWQPCRLSEAQAPNPDPRPDPVPP